MITGVRRARNRGGGLAAHHLETLEPEVLHPVDDNVTAVPSALFPLVVSGGEKASAPVILAHVILPVATTPIAVLELPHPLDAHYRHYPHPSPPHPSHHIVGRDGSEDSTIAAPKSCRSTLSQYGARAASISSSALVLRACLASRDARPTAHGPLSVHRLGDWRDGVASGRWTGERSQHPRPLQWTEPLYGYTVCAQNVPRLSGSRERTDAEPDQTVLASGPIFKVRRTAVRSGGPINDKRTTWGRKPKQRTKAPGPCSDRGRHWS